MPAIHRNRAEIREIFLREMAGVDPDAHRRAAARWPMAARTHLRRKFLRARVAISGANFGVAETGTLAVVESEGNGRMCLTLPETLITVMGIEKLVPTWRDLEVFLQLLPRSSTGERMNPYTSMWTGVTPGDGPQEFHLVLLDNGRTAALADAGRPRGAALHPLLGLPQRLPGLRAHRRPRLRLGLPGPDRRGAVAAADRRSAARPDDSLPYASSLCGACYDVCPVRSTSRRCWSSCAPSTPRRRATHRCRRAEAAAMAAAAWVMARPEPVRRAAGRAAGPAARPGAGRIRRAAAAAVGLDRRRDLPAPPPQTFRDWWAAARPAGGATP